MFLQDLKVSVRHSFLFSAELIDGPGSRNICHVRASALRIAQGCSISDAERTKQEKMQHIAAFFLPDGVYVPRKKTLTDQRSGFCEAKVLNPTVLRCKTCLFQPLQSESMGLRAVRFVRSGIIFYLFCNLRQKRQLLVFFMLVYWFVSLLGLIINRIYDIKRIERSRISEYGIQVVRT